MQPSKSPPLLFTERAQEGADHTHRRSKEGSSRAKPHASLDHGSRPSVSVKKTYRSPDGGSSKARVAEDPVMLSTRKSTSSKTVLRRLTTKLRLPLSSALPKPPPHTSSYAAQGGREAALRACGLLPPLQPKPDLSTQEQEQDLRYSVVVPLQDVDSDIDITAAKKIKQEWEARNQALSSSEDEAMLARNRLQAFKFGGSAVSAGVPDEVVITVTNDVDPSSLTPPTPPEEAPAIEVSTCSTADGPSPSTTPPNTRSRLGRPPALDLSQGRRRSLSRPRPSPTGPLPPLPAEAEIVYSPRCIPLPASQPTTPKTPSSAIDRPLPPPTSPPAAQSTFSKINAPIPPSPRFHQTHQSPKLKPDEVHFISETHSQGDTTSSIDSSMASSHLHAFKVKSIELGVPAILESLVEEKMNSTKLQAAFEIEDRVEQQHTSPPDVLVIPQRSKDTRRKSFGLFRRQDNSDAISVTSAASSQSKKNTVFNLRRSIFGPLSPKSVDRQRLGSAFDASHLPPSPTLPLSFADQAKGTSGSALQHSQSSPALAKARAPPSSNKRGYAMPSPPQSPRQAVSPKIHSRGSIQIETHGIQDEESRRLCELAFIN